MLVSHLTYACVLAVFAIIRIRSSRLQSVFRELILFALIHKTWEGGFNLLKMSIPSAHLCSGYPSREWTRGSKYRYKCLYRGVEEIGVTAVFDNSIIQMTVTPIDHCSAVLHASHVFAMAPDNGFTTTYSLLVKVGWRSASESCFITVNSRHGTAEDALRAGTGHLLTGLRFGDKISFTVYL